MADGHKMCVVHVLMFLFLVAYTSGKDCVQQDNCSCRFDDGSGVIDLTSLGNKDKTPRFKDVWVSDDNLYYSYNPCGGFNEGQCQNAAISGQCSSQIKTVQIRFGWSGANCPHMEMILKTVCACPGKCTASGALNCTSTSG